MKQSDAFPSRYMSKDDVKAPLTLHIAHVSMENIGTESEQEMKPIMQFQEPDAKPMILNNTNWVIIAAIHGPESDDWSGKPITLFFDPTVQYMGKLVGGVRCRQAKVAANPPSAKTEDVPF